jgi:hypothetical protein
MCHSYFYGQPVSIISSLYGGFSGEIRENKYSIHIWEDSIYGENVSP